MVSFVHQTTCVDRFKEATVYLFLVVIIVAEVIKVLMLTNSPLLALNRVDPTTEDMLILVDVLLENAL